MRVHAFDCVHVALVTGRLLYPALVVVWPVLAPGACRHVAPTLGVGLAQSNAVFCEQALRRTSDDLVDLVCAGFGGAHLASPFFTVGLLTI